MTYHVPILLYHRVTAEVGPKDLAPYRVTPAAFEAQLRFLKSNGYYPIGSDELLSSMQSGLPFRGSPIMLTFDDGYTDFFTNAWPLLKKYDFFAEVFIVTEKVGRQADWDREYGEPAPLMAWETIRQLAAGGIRFGSHLATHTRVEMLSEDELLREARDSRTALESMLGRQVRSIALPHGGGDEVTFRVLDRCGYEIEYGTSVGLASISAPRMGLPRIEICNTDDVASFARKILRNRLTEAQGRVAALEAAVVESGRRANQLGEMLDEHTRQLTESQGRVAALETAVVDSDQRANQLGEMLDEHTRQLTESQGRVAALETAVVDSDQRANQLGEMLDQRSRQFTESQGRVAALEAARVDSDQRASQLGEMLDQRTRRLTDAQGRVAALEAAVVDSDQRANQLGEMLDQRSRQFTESQGRVAALEAAVVDSDQRTSQLGEMLDQRTRQLAESQGRVTALEAAVVDNARRVAELRCTLKERTSEAARARETVAGIANLLAQKERDLASKVRRIGEIKASLSWRLTAPFRDLYRPLQRLRARRFAVKMRAAWRYPRNSAKRKTYRSNRMSQYAAEAQQQGRNSAPKGITTHGLNNPSLLYVIQNLHDKYIRKYLTSWVLVHFPPPFSRRLAERMRSRMDKNLVRHYKKEHIAIILRQDPQSPSVDEALQSGLQHGFWTLDNFRLYQERLEQVAEHLNNGNDG